MPQQQQSLIKTCLYLHRKIIELTHNDVVGGATELGRLLSVPRTNTDRAYLQGLTDVQLRTEQRKRLGQLRKAQKAYANRQRAQAKETEAQIARETEQRMRQAEVRVVREVEECMQVVADVVRRAMDEEENRIP